MALENQSNKITFFELQVNFRGQKINPKHLTDLTKMEVHLSNDRIIAYHRNRKDYVDAPENTLRFAYGDSRYEKMTKDLVCETDILKLKTLEEINEDFRRSDFINLALMSSDLLSVLVDHLRDKTDSIRELASRAIV